jgi:hypothetical protein
MESAVIYGDTETGVSRVGLRQTDLTTRLENNRKYKNKTKSVMYNAAMSKSKNSLLDNVSLTSHKSGSTDMLLNNGLNPNLQTRNMNNNLSYNTQQSCYNNGIPMPRQQPSQNRNNWPQNNVQNDYYQEYDSHSQHPQGYNNGYNNNYNRQDQQISIPQQGQASYELNGKKKYRESYMYLNNFGTNQTDNYQQQQQQQQQQQTHHLNLKRISGSPNFIQRRFSSHGGVIGSPMTINNEENARKISFNALMGVHTPISNNNENIIDTLNYMNSIDNNEEWESIDEGGYYASGSKINITDNNINQSEMTKIIQRLQLENRNLKKRLKDIELGHDSNSIVADDEKYSKLEENYNELANSYILKENETKNLVIQNDSYFKDITSLRSKLSNSEDLISKFTALTRIMIERLPNFVRKKDTFNSLFIDSISSINELPVQIKDSYLRAIEKFDIQKNNKQLDFNDVNITDADIIKMLKDDVSNLYSALLRSEDKLKKMDKVYNSKIQDERKTIIVSSLQSKLHNEFLSENSNSNKKIGLKNFRIIKIFPNEMSTGNEVEINNNDLENDFDKTLTINSPGDINSNFSDSTSQANLKLNISTTPVTPLSEDSVDSFSLKRLSIYSNPLDHLVHSESESDSKIKKINELDDDEDDDFFSTHSKNRISGNSLEMEFEKFTT